MIAALATLVMVMASLAGGAYDVRYLRIPNALVAAIMIAFLVAYVASPESFGRWWEHVGAFVLIFALTYGMFSYGLLGGGDAKLASALALWVGLHGLMAYIFFMALVGGMLGAAALVIRKKKPFKNPLSESWIAQLQAGKNAVPYGVAISIGAWAGILHTGLLGHQLDEVIKLIH